MPDTRHRVDTYIEGDLYGWQCLDPGCREEATGYEDIEDAEAAGDEETA